MHIYRYLTMKSTAEFLQNIRQFCTASALQISVSEVAEKRAVDYVREQSSHINYVIFRPRRPIFPATALT